MTETSAKTLSVVVEREIPHPPENQMQAIGAKWLVEARAGRANRFDHLIRRRILTFSRGSRRRLSPSRPAALP